MRVLVIASLLALAGCSSGPETAEDCIDRHSDYAEAIDFFDNELFGATYTYELHDADTFINLSRVKDGVPGFEEAQFRITDGVAYMTILKTVPLEQKAVAFGCNSAPDNSRLVRIDRGRLPSDTK